MRLLVLCTDRRVADRYARPIDLGDGDRITPRVLGPDAVPVIVDAAEAAEHAELAVLSALVHGADPARRAVLDALPAALAAVDPDVAGMYCDIVLAALPEVARLHLEALVAVRNYEYQSDFARKYFGQGRTEGLAAAVLDVFAARDVPVAPAERERIMQCTDETRIRRWLRAAVTAGSAAELLAE